MIDVRKETLKGAKWGAISKYSNTLFSLVIGVVLARLLSPSDYGLLGMTTMFMMVSSIFVDSGFANALIQKKDASDVDFSTVFYINVVISLFCYIILFVCAPFIASFFSAPVLTTIIRVQSLQIVIGSLGSVHFVRFSKNLNFKTPAYISMITAIVGGVVALVLAFTGWGVWALVFQGLVSSFLSVILVWFMSSWRPLLQFSYSSFKALFGFGNKLLATSLLSSAYPSVTNTLIAKFYSAADLGFYTKGVGVAQHPINFIFHVMYSAVYPVMSKIQDDDERLMRVYRKYIRMSCMVVFFSMILFAALAQPLVIYVYTEKWQPAVVFVQLTCFISMFIPISTLNIDLMLVKGRSDLQLKCEVYRKLVWFTLLVVTLPISVTAILIGGILGAQGSLFINTYYTKKHFGYGFFQQWKDIGIYLIFSLISCVPAYLLSFSNLHPLLIMILGSGIAVVIYIGILRRKDKEHLMELWTILPKQKLRKLPVIGRIIDCL